VKKKFSVPAVETAVLMRCEGSAFFRFDDSAPPARFRRLSAAEAFSAEGGRVGTLPDQRLLRRLPNPCCAAHLCGRFSLNGIASHKCHVDTVGSKLGAAAR
jgi:hypothetical protein